MYSSAPPPQPRKPTVSKVTHNSAQISWSTPASGVKISGYHIEKKETNTIMWQRENIKLVSKGNYIVKGLLKLNILLFDVAKYNSYFLSGLIEGIGYQIRVIAENEAGLSEPSDACDSFVATKAIGAPTDLHVVEINTGSICLEWTAPEDALSSNITSYIIEQRQSPKGRWQKCNYEVVSKCEYEVQGLVRLYSYDFRVTAKTNIGTLGVSSDICGPVLFKVVPESPTVQITGLKPIKIRATNTLKINAEVNGKPRPETIWYKNGVDISNDVRISVINTRMSSILIMDRLTREDLGEYSVMVSNAKGDAKDTVDVLVLDTPGKPEGPLELSSITSTACSLNWKQPLLNGGSEVRHYIVSKCDTSKLLWTVVKEKCEALSCRITKLNEQKEYVFKVCAVNEFGTGPPLQSVKITPRNMFGVPSPPGKPEAVRIHINSITIGYTAPENDGGSRIIGYHIERLKNRGSRWAKCNEDLVTDLQYRVTGLTEGSFYEFRVIAENAAGMSIASEVSPLVECKLPISPPGPPCILRLIDTTNNSASLEWEAPLNDNGSPVTGYVVEKKKFDRTDTAEWNRVNETPIEECKMIVDDLVANEVYELQVRAVNKAGIGEPCECNDFIKAVDRFEEPEFNVSPNFKSHISVHAGQPLELGASFHGKPAPEVQWLKLGKVPLNSLAVTSATDTGASLLIEKSKREDRGKYTMSIKNKLGMKKLTFSVKVFDTPGQVGSIICKDIKCQSVVLNWIPPEHDGCSPVNAYMIEKREASSNRYLKVIGDCARTYHKVTGLEEGRSYIFRITALNEFGSGESRETEKKIKTVETPSSPIGLELDEVSVSAFLILTIIVKCSEEFIQSKNLCSKFNFVGYKIKHQSILEET